MKHDQSFPECKNKKKYLSIVLPLKYSDTTTLFVAIDA